MPNEADRLGSIKTFDDLVRYLEDELDWSLGNATSTSSPSTTRPPSRD